MSSSSDTLTPEELETLISFRKSVEDILQPKHNDRFLLRWLRARDFKLCDAEDMLRKHMMWRRIARADDILQIYKEKEVIAKYSPLGMLCCDKTGCPVWLARCGEADLKGLVYSTTRSDALSHFAYIMESNECIMEENSLEREVPVDGILGIVDLENISLHSMTCAPVLRRLRDLEHWLQNNYPEVLKACYIINAPNYIQVFMMLIKSFLSENTYQKMHVFGRDGWKEELLKEIDEAVLPVKFGGKRIGPNNDENAYDLIREGRTVPKSYYIKCNLLNEEDAKVTEVEAQKSYTVEVIVNEPKSILNWEFKTKDHNIGFGLFYKRNGKLEENIPIEKQNCNITPENGSWLCTEAGTYALIFDNSYSWIRPKIVSYWTEVIPPGGE